MLCQPRKNLHYIFFIISVVHAFGTSQWNSNATKIKTRHCPRARDLSHFSQTGSQRVFQSHFSIKHTDNNKTSYKMKLRTCYYLASARKLDSYSECCTFVQLERQFATLLFQPRNRPAAFHSRSLLWFYARKGNL